MMGWLVLMRFCIASSLQVGDRAAGLNNKILELSTVTNPEGHYGNNEKGKCKSIDEG